MNATIISPEEFYADCAEGLHNLAKTYGLANRGIIYIPELSGIRYSSVLHYLKDDTLREIGEQDSDRYYYVLVRKCLFEGMAVAEKWHDAFGEITQNDIEILRKKGIEKIALKLLDHYVGITNDELELIAKEFYIEWFNQSEPYWKLNDPRQYVLNGLQSVFQVGVSIVLERLGY